MYLPPPPPAYVQPYHEEASFDKQQINDLVLYGRDVIYDTEQSIVIFKLDDPFGISAKIKKHKGTDIVMRKQSDSRKPPKDCPSFELKPENVTVGYMGIFSGYITLTTTDVSSAEAAPVLDKQCAKVKTKAVKFIIEREEKERQRYNLND